MSSFDERIESCLLLSNCVISPGDKQGLRKVELKADELGAIKILKDQSENRKIEIYCSFAAIKLNVEWTGLL